MRVGSGRSSRRSGVWPISSPRHAQVEPHTVLRARHALGAFLTARNFDCVICHSQWTQGIFGPTVRRARLAVGHVGSRASNRAPLERAVGRSNAAGPGDLHQRFHCADRAVSVQEVPIEVVHPPVEMELPTLPAGERCRVRAELSTAENAVVIIQPSRIEAWKGHAALVDALGELPICRTGFGGRLAECNGPSKQRIWTRFVNVPEHLGSSSASGLQANDRMFAGCFPLPIFTARPISTRNPSASPLSRHFPRPARSDNRPRRGPRDRRRLMRLARAARRFGSARYRTPPAHHRLRASSSTGVGGSSPGKACLGSHEANPTSSERARKHCERAGRARGAGKACRLALRVWKPARDSQGGSSSDAIYRMVADAVRSRGIRGARLVDVGCGCALWPFLQHQFSSYCGIMMPYG